MRLWKKARTPRREAREVQYSFIVFEREREKREERNRELLVEKVTTLRLNKVREENGFLEKRGRFD